MPNPRKSDHQGDNVKGVARHKQSRKEIAAAAKAAESQKNKSARRTRIFAISVIVGTIILVVSFFTYLIVVVPYQRVILTVGKDNVKTGYFLRRLVANPTGDIANTLQSLTEELVIDQQAPAIGLTNVTTQDINSYLHDAAKKAKGIDTITDNDFDAWFREQLANTGLPAKEYREIAANDILRTRERDIVSANIKSIAPQIHLWAIVLGSEGEALQVKMRIDGGEDFGTIAAVYSLDSQAKTNKGDMGWLPPDLLDSQLRTIAATIQVGKCSDPITYTQQSSSSSTSTTTEYVLLMVSEKSDAKEMTTDQLATLKNQALVNWLNSKESSTMVVIHGLNGSKTIDAQTTDWLMDQAKKLSSKLARNPVTTAPTTESPTNTTQTTNTLTTSTLITTAPTTTSPSTTTTLP